MSDSRAKCSFICDKMVNAPIFAGVLPSWHANITAITATDATAYLKITWHTLHSISWLYGYALCMLQLLMLIILNTIHNIFREASVSHTHNHYHLEAKRRRTITNFIIISGNARRKQWQSSQRKTPKTMHMAVTHNNSPDTQRNAHLEIEQKASQIHHRQMISLVWHTTNTPTYTRRAVMVGTHPLKTTHTT